jgi:rRNA maturation endonuclease Nob1
MLNIHFTTPKQSLSIVIRPRCPKCKKEFMLDLTNYFPGKHHACYACGTVTQFDTALAEKVQKQTKDLAISIQEIFESFRSE